MLAYRIVLNEIITLLLNAICLRFIDATLSRGFKVDHARTIKVSSTHQDTQSYDFQS